MSPSHRARRGVGLFLAVLALYTAACHLALLRVEGPLDGHPGLLIAYMWGPAVASVVARLLLREGFRDVSFRLGGAKGARGLLLAWLLPALAAGPAYAVAWATGLADFAPPALVSLGLQAQPDAVRFAAMLGYNLTVGLLISAVTATGEEVGWRGFLLTRLVDSGWPRPVLLSGLIWWAWHLPILLSGRYLAGAHPLVSALGFLVPLLAAAYVTAWLRLRTGSVWPAVVLHSSSNAVVQEVFDASTRHPSVWVGEAGVLVGIASVVAALMARRLLRPGSRESPGEVPSESVGAP